MRRTPIIASGSAHTVEVLLGREKWTYADYLADAFAHYDAEAAAGRIHFTATMSRDGLAKALAELQCPPAKLSAHRAEQRAKLYAEFGAPVGAAL